MLADTIAIMVSQNPPMSDVFFETCFRYRHLRNELRSYQKPEFILFLPDCYYTALCTAGRIGSFILCPGIFTRSNRKPLPQLPAERTS